MGRQFTALVTALSFLVASCGGGGGTSPAATSGSTSGSVYTPPAQQSLTAADVQTVIGHAISEATARHLPAVVAVTDRVGNVLAVYRMTGAAANAVTAPAPNGQNMDAQGLTVPAEAGAIAKAITGAYLSSSGNAFSTRTASEIVQQHFPPSPAAAGQPGGPLFGVQFSQLPCSDLTARFASATTSSYIDPATGATTTTPGLIGPKRSPLGLAADPGGFPLYKNGVVVGGVGIMADGVYGLDPDASNVDNDPEEFIGLAATLGYEAPETIRADHINAGVLLIYSDATYAGLLSNSVAPLAGNGVLEAIPGYSDGTLLAGTAYGTAASGYRQATTSDFSNTDAYVLTDGAGNDRFPIRAATDTPAGGTSPLTKAEVTTILQEAFTIMSRARAQIRQPLDSRAQVTISMVDTNGAILGVVRAPDAPIFGTDVSLQKARTATFFSSATAAQVLLADPSTDVQHFVGALRTFLGKPDALTGTYAFADRSGGNLSRPFFPDGEDARPNGPFSRPIAQFNPFSTGLQSALILANLGQHLTYVVSGGTQPDTPSRCTSTPRLGNGIQIFPGSVPIYRNGVLVGGIGVSGDGIDQDDMISFLGLNNGGAKAGNGLGNAPASIRADNIVVTLGDGSTVGLRYVSCPIAPFLDTSANNVCEGL